MKKALLFFVCILLAGAIASAQDGKKRAPYMPWEVGVDLGISLFGDEYNMNEEARWNKIDHWSSEAGFGGELFVRKYFGYVMGAELAYSYNTLKGDWDEPFGGAVPSFDTRVNDITLQAVVNFNNLFTKNRWDRDWYIFGKAGVGIGWVNIEEGVLAGANAADDAKFLVPLGLGAAYKLSDDIKVSLSADFKLMNTDRLDARYETGVVGAGTTTGVWGSYAMFSAGVSYTFGKYRGQEKMMSSNVIPVSQPVTKPAPEPKPVPAVKPERPTPPPTNNYTAPKPPSTPKPTPPPTPTMSSDVIDGMMYAKAGWPVNKGYVYGEIPASGVDYRVQVLATYRQAKDLDKLGTMIRISDELIEYRGKRLYKYAIKKTYNSYSSALAAARQVNRTAKISDAFVVGFLGSKHIY